MSNLPSYMQRLLKTVCWSNCREIDGTITRTMIVIIKSMAHVCSNTFLSMSLLHWLTKRTHQTFYREKAIAEVFWKQWLYRDWMLKNVSEIAFCVILTTGFLRIVIRSWFTGKGFGTNYYYYYSYHYHYYGHFYYSIIFIMMISVIISVFLLSLLLILL